MASAVCFCITINYFSHETTVSFTHQVHIIGMVLYMLWYTAPVLTKGEPVSLVRVLTGDLERTCLHRSRLYVAVSAAKPSRF